MQRILRFGEDLQAYLALQDPADAPGALDCPICPDGHRLRRHAWYRRWAYLPQGAGVCDLAIDVQQATQLSDEERRRGKSRP